MISGDFMAWKIISILVSNISFLLYVVVLFLVSLGEFTIKILTMPISFLLIIFSKFYSHINEIKPNEVLLSVRYWIKWLFLKLYDLFYIIKKRLILIVTGLTEYIRGNYLQHFIYGFITCLVAFFLYQSYSFISNLPNPRSIGKVNFSQSTHLYDRNGKLLYEIYRDVNRTSVHIEGLPDYIIQATITIEDKNFYNHMGVSFFGGILRAAKDTYQTKELQGGSTLTQQLVKTALLTPERTISRKLKEMLLAVWTEQIYAKDEILEMYLNQVPYGGSSYGIEEASKVYFGKQAKKLTLSEAALLAGLPKAPSIYSPFIDPDLAVKRRNQVINEMFKLGYITSSARDGALAEDLIVQPPTTNIRAPHFVMYMRTLLEKEYGSKKVEESGFEITTTLDLEIQEKVELILKEELEELTDRNVSNGGVIILDPKTGEIIAMVGSEDYFKDSYGAYNVTTALRQPGSALKPVLYAMALETGGFTAASRIDDSPIIFQVPGSESYKPMNYDRKYHGKISIRTALANSYNIPAVKVLNALGVDPFVDFAKKLGIDTWEDSSRFGLSLSLGGGEVTLLDLTQVFSVFANEGKRIEPTGILEIVDYNGRMIYAGNGKSTQVIDPAVAFIISDILDDDVARLPAFGLNNKLDIKGYRVSVKTGTTNDYKDAWTIGYTPDIVVGVWVGNNDNTSMKNLPGSLGAAPIFNRIMTYLLEEHDAQGEYKIPENVVGVPCYAGKLEFFVSGSDISKDCYRTVIKSATPTIKP